MKPANDRISASIMDRLRAQARTTGELFNPLLDRYVATRLLYRLTRSRFADQYLLKGAMMFLIWHGEMHRPTRDIDLLGPSADVDEIADCLREICAIPCPEDGVRFDPTSLKAQAIREGARYGGVRIALVGRIGTARIPVQVDVGFGDDVVPAPSLVELPSLIRGVPGASMRGYKPETVIAEKFEAMVSLGQGNSRMKDFVDIATIANTLEVGAAGLIDALRATFKRRQTELPTSLPLALTDTFWADPQTKVRWGAFVTRNGIRAPYADARSVVQTIAKFLGPCIERAYDEANRTALWSAGEWHRRD